MSSGPRVILWCGSAALISLLALASRSATPQRSPHHPAEEVPPQPVQDLYLADTKDFPAPAPEAILSGIKCDSSGNIYVVYSPFSQDERSGPDGTSVLAISKLSPDSESITQYTLPAIPGYVNLVRYGFDVDSSGNVYALVGAEHLSGSDAKPKPTFLIIKYDDDGAMDSFMNVGDIPEKHIQPLSIGVFGDGDFLLSGTTRGEKVTGTFTGIFDRQGTFETPLKLGISHFKRPEEDKAVTKVTSQDATSAESKPEEQENNAADDPSTGGTDSEINPVSLESSTLSFSSPDGNIYVLQGTSVTTLYAVSPAGQVDQRAYLHTPPGGPNPLQMAGAGVGYLFIAYEHIAPGAPSENLHQAAVITIINSETGHVVATYRMPSGAAGYPACADSSDDFLFLGNSKDNHLEVARYVAR